MLKTKRGKIVAAGLALIHAGVFVWALWFSGTALTDHSPNPLLEGRP